MDEFAKLFDTEIGQVVVMLSTDDDSHPEVRLFFRPEGMGVSSMAFGFNDDEDESFEKAEKIFSGFDQELAEKFVTNALHKMGLV